MQPPSTFYARYPPTMLPPSVPSYAQAPPPPSYVYQQYPTYPPVAYTHSYTPLVHTAAPAAFGASRNAQPYATNAASERDAFYRKLHAFRDALGEPIQRLPTLGFKELDLWVLYKEVIKRHGIDAVIAKKQWKEVAEALQLPSSCTDSGFRLRLHYKKYLEAFERKFYKPPIDVEVRERKKKRNSSSSESAETEVAVGEESVGSIDKGSEISRERRSPVVKRKRRSMIKRDKKKEDVDSRHSVATPVDVSSLVDSVSKGRMDETKDRGRDGDVAMTPRPESDKTFTPAVSPSTPMTEVTIQSKPAEAQAAELRVSVGGSSGMKAGKAERDAARALVEAKTGCIASIGRRNGGLSAISKRRHKVDFTVLDCATLRRYVRAHGVGGAEVELGGKVALAECVAQHFSDTPLRDGETEVLIRFIQAVRRR